MSDDRLHNQDREINRPLVELISAYLDDRESLSSDELAHVELLLEQDNEAQQVYAELQVITRGLQSLGPVTAPRSFHLNAEMVGAPEPVVMQETSAWHMRHAASVRWVTAAAAVLFVFVLGADLVLNNVLSDPSNGSDVLQTDQAEMTNRSSDDDAAADGADQAELFEEEAGDEAGGGEEAAEIPTPEVAEDSGGTSLVRPAEATATESADEDAEEGETEGDGTESIATDEPEPQPAAESTPSTEMFAAEDAQADTGDEDSDSDRRLWRIAEFSLVVLLGLLITAMVVLPRLGNAARSNGE